MFFTTVCEYAIRALTHLAVHGNERPIQVKEIAEAERIPRHFLAKILNQLTYKGLVRALRGPGGGFLLTKPPEEVFVKDIVEVIDGFDSIRNRCVLGLDECQDSEPCPLHESWKQFRERFLDGVSELTLATMGANLEHKREHHKPPPGPAITLGDDDVSES
jgi:Rrf2 family protein